MKALGIDLNATTAWAVHGALNHRPKEVTLDPVGKGLPMVLNIKGRKPRVGYPGLSVCRAAPHWAYTNFFGDLSETSPRERNWWTRRQQWDSYKATEVVLRHLKHMCPTAEGTAFALPGYFTNEQTETIEALARKTKWTSWGTISAPLSAALYAYSQSAWSPSILVVDVDDHAMTIGIVDAVHGHAQLRQTRIWTNLAWRKWIQQTINGLAEVSIVQNRKDPRVNATADQCLFDQIGTVFQKAGGTHQYTIEVRAEHWYFQLSLLPQQTVQFCAALLNDAVCEIQSAWRNDGQTTFDKVFLTYRAGRLPGLAARLRQEVGSWMEESVSNDASSGIIHSDDFGYNLTKDEPTDSVVILPPDALARGSHLFASLIQQGVLSSGRYDQQVTLFLPQQISA